MGPEPEPVAVLAGDVAQTTRGWRDLEVLIPDAMTDPGPPPQFGSEWVGVEAVYTEGDLEGPNTVFVLDGDPPGVRWGVPMNREVQVRGFRPIILERFNWRTRRWEPVGKDYEDSPDSVTKPSDSRLSAGKPPWWLRLLRWFGMDV